jgi:hypothetical protein
MPHRQERALRRCSLDHAPTTGTMPSAPFGISHAMNGHAGHFERIGRFDQALSSYNEAIGIRTQYDIPIDL